MLFIFTIILVSSRIAYLIYNKQKFVLYKELLMLCFIIYILLLYYIVTFQDNNYGTNNFIPFKEIFRYDFNSALFFRNVVGNVLLFVPFGVFISHYIKNKNFLLPMFLSLIVSCSIEFAQSAIGRTADVDDVILNTLGGIFGFLLYHFGNKITSKLPKTLKSETFLNAIAIILILLVLYLAFKFNFWGIIS